MSQRNELLRSARIARILYFGGALYYIQERFVLNDLRTAYRDLPNFNSKNSGMGKPCFKSIADICDERILDRVEHKLLPVYHYDRSFSCLRHSSVETKFPCSINAVNASRACSKRSHQQRNSKNGFHGLSPIRNRVNPDYFLYSMLTPKNQPSPARPS